MNRYLSEVISKRRIESGTSYNLSDKILIFDTFFGLCNQIYDIHYGINFCLKNKIKFTFRYSNFRKDDLTTFYDVKFDELFDTDFLKKIKLYVDFNTLDLTEENTYNLTTNIHAPKMLKNNIKYLNYIKEPYIVLKGIFSLIEDIEISMNILDLIKPSPKIMNIYTNIYDKLELNKESYNFLHYRYEHDFTVFHHINTIKSLQIILDTIRFKNPAYKIYIASSNVKRILNNVNTSNLIYKNEDEIALLNFEERAFIDFMIGKHSSEVYGHDKSSFSHALNKFKSTKNYY